jgi:hypothetical protein
MAIGEELDYDHSVHSRNRGGDEKLAVRFFKKARPNPEQSQKEGRTVEHMADLRDDICQKIMGATALKQKARIFVDASKAEAPMKALQAAMELRDSELASLKNSVAEQAAIIKELREKMKDD